MLAALVCLALLAQVPAGPAPADSAGARVRAAQAAVEAGRDTALRRAWSARRAADLTDRTALLVLATLDRLTYRYPAAERDYALLLAGGPDDTDLLTAHARLGLGILRAQQARLAEAGPLLRAAEHSLRRRGQAAGAAEALAVLATVSSRTTSLDSALVLLAAADRLAPPRDDWLRSSIRCSELLVRVRRADAAAARLARPGAEWALRSGNPRAAAACLAALAQDYERRTVLDSALAVFGEVAALQRAARNYSALAATRQWEGYLLDLRGNFAEGRAALSEALTLGRATGAQAAAAWASLGLADLALSLGDLRASGRYAALARASFGQTGDRWGLLVTRLHEGDVALLNRTAPAARAAFEEVAREAPAVSPSLAVHAHGRLAAVALLEGDRTDAERELDRARRLARTLAMPGWREEDGYGRALLALQRERPAEARRRLLALRAIMPADELAASSELLTRLAEAEARTGDLDGAVGELEQAGALLDRWRARLPDRELRLAVVQARRLDWDRDLGFATVIREIAAHGRVAAAFRLAEQRRARVLLEEMVRRRALATGPTPSGPTPAAATSAAAVRRLLPPSTALLAFVTGNGGEPTTVFVLTRDSLTAVGAEAVDDHGLELERFAGLVSAGHVPGELAQTLGRAFLAGALAHVPAGTRRLVIVPDGPLYHVPFDVLGDGRGRLLVERYALALAPAASVAARWWTAAPGSPGPRLVAFGDPLTGADADGADPRLARLPAAAAEVRRIARYAPSADVYVGREASEARLRRADLADVGVLHFAVHAQADDWSLLHGALLLAPGGGEDGRVAVDELAGLKLPGALVVLSACRSGDGAVLAGEGLDGLTEPLLEAGAATVVASLWQIGDRGAARFMELFYQQLAAGATVGDGLAAAKRLARARGMSPAVWAAFTLTGDGRARTALRRPSRLPSPAQAGTVFGLAAVAYLVGWTTSRRKGERR